MAIARSVRTTTRVMARHPIPAARDRTPNLTEPRASPASQPLAGLPPSLPLSCHPQKWRNCLPNRSCKGATTCSANPGSLISAGVNPSLSAIFGARPSGRPEAIASAAAIRRLPDHHQRARPFGLVRRQQPRGLDPRGHVGAVPAGVHHPGFDARGGGCANFGSERQPGVRVEIAIGRHQPGQVRGDPLAQVVGSGGNGGEDRGEDRCGKGRSDHRRHLVAAPTPRKLRRRFPCATVGDTSHGDARA